MAVKLRLKLPLALSIWLLWLQLGNLSLPRSEARILEDKRIFDSHSADAKPEIVEYRNLTVNSELDRSNKTEDATEQSTEKSSNITQENSSTEQPRAEAPREDELKPFVVSQKQPKIVEFGPRITLDTLPVCGDGFKLFGNHCRKEA